MSNFTIRANGNASVHGFFTGLFDLPVDVGMTWWSISAYFKQSASEDANKKYKNVSQKKKYITDVLNMPLQFDPGFEKRKFCFGLNLGTPLRNLT